MFMKMEETLEVQDGEEILTDDESRKGLLRTHTTVNTVQTLSRKPK